MQLMGGGQREEVVIEVSTPTSSIIDSTAKQVSPVNPVSLVKLFVRDGVSEVPEASACPVGRLSL